MSDFQKKMKTERAYAFQKLNQEFQKQMIALDLSEEASSTGYDPNSPEYSKVELMVGNYRLAASDIRRQFLGATPGDVACWGLNDFSQLGWENGGIDTWPPKLLTHLQRRNMIQVGGGGMHSISLDDNGTPWTWGVNDDGTLGRKTADDEDAAKPNIVEGFVTRDGKSEDKQIVQITSGDSHCLFLSASGHVYSVGIYKEKDSAKFKIPPGPGQSAEGTNELPQHIWEMPGKVKFIDSGGDFAAAILKDSTMVTWGMGQVGELARSVDMTDKNEEGKYVLDPSWYKREDGSINEDIIRDKFMKPQPPRFNYGSPKKQILTIGCGLYHLLVIAREPNAVHPNVYSSGVNQYGQLGHGDKEERHELTLIKKLEGKNIAQVVGGEHFSMALCNQGKRLYAWGREDRGCLGLGHVSEEAGGARLFPTLVKFPAEEPVLISKIQAGDRHAFAITPDHDLYTWGFEGTTGHRGYENNDCIQPKMLDISSWLKRKSKVFDIAGGGQHSVAVTMGYGRLNSSRTQSAEDDGDSSTAMTN